MRRILAVVVGALGLGALLQRWRRHRQRESPVPAPEPAPDTDSLAEELRAKLAESRAAAPPSEEPVAEEPVAVARDDLDARRREVHERARQAADELASSQPAPED